MEWAAKDDWPDWEDTGRKVVMEMPDGDIVTGTLKAEEFFTGEDEVPIFYVETNGEEISFAEANKWCFEL